MRVLMVTPYYYPPIGGAEISTENLAKQLNARHIPTDVMTFNADPCFRLFSNTKIHGINVIGIPALDLKPLRIPELLLQIQFFPRNFRDYLKEYDVIHFQNDIELSFQLFTYNISKPKVFHCRCMSGMFHLYDRNPVTKRFFRNSADMYIVISQELVKYLTSLGIQKERIRVIPNGIDTQKFWPIKQKIEDMLLFVGRLDPVKGLHVLLQSLDLVKHPVILAIVGGPSWDHEYSEEVLNLIKETSKKTVHKILYLGHLDRTQIIEWFQKSSIHVRPDISGISGGNTALEAMACETPVIGTGNGIIKNGVNGVIVPPNNAIELAKAIEFLLQNGDVRRHLGEGGRRFVTEKFSFDAVIAQIIKVYRDVGVN